MASVYTKSVCGPAAVLDLSNVAYPPVTEPNGGFVPVPEYDHSILCVPGTGERIIVTTLYNPATPPITEAFTLSGAPYGGQIDALLACDDIELESDPIVICVNGVTELYQWVVKDNGQPNGDVFYTDTAGLVVAAPAVGTFVVGSCQTRDFDFELICGRDGIGGPMVYQQIAVNTITGQRTATYWETDGVTQMTLSNDFVPDKERIDNEERYIHVTNTGAGQAEYGRVSLVKQLDVLRDGVLDPAATTYWNTAVIPNIDVTTQVAALVAAGSQIDVAPVRVQLPEGGALATQTQTVTGDANLALADIPQFATYAEIYIEAGTADSGLRWTKDGSAPADGAANEQERTGTTIRLLDRNEIDGFRASAMNLSTGDIDAAGSATIKAIYWNVAPDED